MPTFEDHVESVLRDYVTTKAALGIYDPINPRRPKVPVKSFTIEFLEVDEDLMAHVAGPVFLETATGDVEKFLRVSARVSADGEISDVAEIRAVYVEETDPETGACKETAALANA